MGIGINTPVSKVVPLSAYSPERRPRATINEIEGYRNDLGDLKTKLFALESQRETIADRIMEINRAIEAKKRSLMSAIHEYFGLTEIMG